MVCPTCGSTYKPCKCQGGKCPICKRATSQKLVLVEYTGAAPSLTIGRYIFSKNPAKAYIKPSDLAMVLAHPSMKQA